MLHPTLSNGYLAELVLRETTTTYRFPQELFSTVSCFPLSFGSLFGYTIQQIQLIVKVFSICTFLLPLVELI
jgi:hypothetical protein